MDEELSHDGVAYDAAKRREYYLRTRKLKGRHHGLVKIAPPHKTRAERQAERLRQQEAKVAELKSRLKRLQEVLAVEVKKAQARSGVKTTKVEPKSTHKSSNSKTEKLTAAQKAKKAREEKKLREKNKPQTLDEQVKSLMQRIKTIQERIDKMRKDGSVGARRNTSK